MSGSGRSFRNYPFLIKFWGKVITSVHNIKSTPIQCQDFESAFYWNPSLMKFSITASSAYSVKSEPQPRGYMCESFRKRFTWSRKHKKVLFFQKFMHGAFLLDFKGVQNIMSIENNRRIPKPWGSQTGKCQKTDLLRTSIFSKSLTAWLRYKVRS